MKTRYELIIYWSKDDDSFVVEVPELPGCMADGQIFQVFQQFFVVGDWQHDRSTFAAIIRDVLNRIAHK